MNLFERLNPQINQPNQFGPNPIYNMFGGFQKFQNAFSQFAQDISKQGGNPQQIVQSLMDSGKMTKEQFQQFSQMADFITGNKRF